MKKRKLWVSILAGFLALLMVLSLIVSVLPSLVGAEKSSSELKSEINELKDKKEALDEEIAGLESQISENMGEIAQIVAQKDIIDQEIFLLHQQIDTINDQIAAYGALIADKQAELDDAQARLEALNEKNKERIRSMEENGSVSYWSVLFKANSFSDLLDRVNMIEEIAAADQRRLKEMSEAAEQVAVAKSELESEKAELEQSKTELDAAQETLNGKREEADELLNQLLAKGAEYDALMEDAENRASEMMSELDDLETQYDEAKEREYQEWLASQPPAAPSGGSVGAPNKVDGVEWLIPISYTRFSSPFGWRLHPIYGDYRFHYGVDLSAPQGTPIVASRSGQVTTTAYEAGGAGYYVSIHHMDGFVTRYLHMTHYIVSPGEYVSAGQVIGYCGSTGASTGPHLHFSVYYNGVAVNPALYINI